MMEERLMRQKQTVEQIERQAHRPTDSLAASLSPLGWSCVHMAKLWVGGRVASPCAYTTGGQSLEARLTNR